MAEYGYEYTNRGNQNKWSAPVHTKDWIKPSYDVPDHVSQPVTIHAEARKMPIINYNPPNSHTPVGHYKEKIIEQIRYTTTGPVILENKIQPHHENYEDNSHNHRRPVVHQFKVHHDDANGHTRSRPAMDQYKIHPHANGEHHKDGNYLRPVVHQYKVHQEHANGENYKDDTHLRPNMHQYKIHPHAKAEHHKDDSYTRPVSHEHKVHPHANHVDPYVETYKEGSYKNDHFYQTPHGKNDHDYDYYSFHKPSSPEGRRPGKFGLISATQWRNMPRQHHGTSEGNKLSGVTNNIGEAMMMLKEVAKPVMYGQKEGIDSRDAARRYESSSPPPRMYGGDYERRGLSLSSTGAAKKYNGTHVFSG